MWYHTQRFSLADFFTNTDNTCNAFQSCSFQQSKSSPRPACSWPSDKTWDVLNNTRISFQVYCESYEVLATVSLTIQLFWDVTLCRFFFKCFIQKIKAIQQYETSVSIYQSTDVAVRPQICYCHAPLISLGVFRRQLPWHLLIDHDHFIWLYSNLLIWTARTKVVYLPDTWNSAYGFTYKDTRYVENITMLRKLQFAFTYLQDSH